MDSLEHDTTTTSHLSEKLLQERNVEGASETGMSEEDFPQANTSWTKGEPQPNVFRDSIYGFIFLAQLALIFGISIAWGFPALNYNDEENSGAPPVHLNGVLWLLLWSFIASIVVSGLVLTFMIRFTDFMVQFSVLFSIFTNLFLMVVSLMLGYPGVALFTFVIFLAACFYAWRVWNRLPFAASNLLTAMTAVHTNWGLLFLSFNFTIVMFVYTLLWALSVIGAIVHKGSKCGDTEECDSSLSGGIIALFILAFYWTQQVIKNVIHVTVAGVVGTWWFVPNEANSGCSKAINESLLRSTTSSFGSICLGSLLVALVQVAHYFAMRARANRRRNIGVLYCILDCLLETLNNLVQYFNKWSYIYVGLYGYSYADAGTKVVSLFRARGWTAIVNDQLVHRVLSLVCFVIGSLTGLVTLLIVASHPSFFSGIGDSNAVWMSFICGILIGVLVSSVLMSVVSSAVDTVVVCYAEAPSDLHAHYPILGRKMDDAWALTYPQEYRRVSVSNLV